MIVLAADTTGRVCSVAISSDGKCLCELTLNDALTHSEALMPMIDRALATARLDVADVDVFAAVIGPGSFTGIRIGVCAIKGLAHGTGKPCVGVNTLDALARNVEGGRLVSPVLDARRGEVYNAVYQDGRRVVEPRALPMADVIAGLNSPALFLGDGADVHREIILAAGHTIAPASVRLPRASSAAALAFEKYAGGEGTSYLELAPFYLRQSQAERLHG